MKRLFKYLFYIFFIPFWLIIRLYPRSSKIWVFGSWFGKKYGDNSKALFEYVNKCHPDYKSIWLSRNPDVINSLRKEGYKSYHANSFMGIWYSLNAGFIFVSSSKIDVNYLFINGAKWIQLYHGAPLKKVGLDDEFSKSDSLFQRRIVKHLFPFVYEFNFHLTTALSSEFSNILCSAFNLSSSQIEITGFPRNDNLFAKESEQIIDKINTKFNNPIKILYLPTFRSEIEKKDLFGGYGFNPNKFQRFLEKINGVLISKGHFVDQNVSNDSSIERIFHLSDSDIKDVYVLAKDSNFLLTDYSSILFDYLLTDNPIIFTAFDLKEYISKNRQLYFQYEDVISGPVVKDWNDVMLKVEEILDHDNYLELRKKQKSRFNAFHDNLNAERVYQAILRRFHH
ncbi:MAG: CDP-glycerol glycerophosphotransferase (TagB/SpsB family) [Psychroserpens sp.]|jgi:CDP-glycerol glycerophosphotransferase (TagB/SpsB family)